MVEEMSGEVIEAILIAFLAVCVIPIVIEEVRNRNV